MSVCCFPSEINYGFIYEFVSRVGLIAIGEVRILGPSFLISFCFCDSNKRIFVLFPFFDGYYGVCFEFVELFFYFLLYSSFICLFVFKLIIDGNIRGGLIMLGYIGVFTSDIV